jgi:hypothetical protein
MVMSRKPQRHPDYGLAIGDRVRLPSREFRGVVVAFGNQLQHPVECAGKIRVYWGDVDQLSWEDPAELELT